MSFTLKKLGQSLAIVPIRKVVRNEIIFLFWAFPFRKLELSFLFASGPTGFLFDVGWHP